jgi:hypothetical protein
MRFQEYGTKQKNVILLLHGGGLSWWNYREVADFLYLFTESEKRACEEKSVNR